MWPNTPRSTGKSAITKATAGVFAIPDFKLEFHPDQIAVVRLGELGYISGTYMSTFEEASGNLLLTREST